MGPVHQEIVSCGGNSDNDGGSPGAKQWARVAAGSEKLRALRENARKLERGMHVLVNAWRNRFYITETEAEAKADIGKQAAALAKTWRR